MPATTPVPIPTDLRRPHELVSATREAARQAKPGHDGRLEVGPRPGVARLRVSPSALRRSLLLLQALLKEAERRGLVVAAVERRWPAQAGVGIGSDAYQVAVEVVEATTQVALTPEETSRWRRANRWRLAFDERLTAPMSRPMPSGHLKLLLPRRPTSTAAPGTGWRSAWTDGPRALVESKLASALAQIQRRVDDEARLATERARQQET